MTEMRTIEIDFDVNKRIELERTSFNETHNDVLHRLLGIVRASPVPTPRAIGRAWSGKGVILPHATELKMEYNGRQHAGVIENGVWLVEGKRFKSPSAAAGGVALTKDGKHTSLDGWIYWRVKRPGDESWTAISQYRA